MQAIKYITMPGQVLEMSVAGDHLFVLCWVERRWWQFWKPRRFKQLVTLNGKDLERVGPRAFGSVKPYLFPLGSLIALGLLSVALIAVFEWR